MANLPLVSPVPPVIPPSVVRQDDQRQFIERLLAWTQEVKRKLDELESRIAALEP